MSKTCTKCAVLKDESEFGYDCRRGKKKILRADCRRCVADRAMRWYRKNPEKIKLRILKRTDKVKVYNLARRKRVVEHYGGKCSCCGEAMLQFMSIDHINGNGSQHRKEIGLKGGEPFYRWIERNNYPAGLQVLCYNCNCAKRTDKFCPHKSILS